jgi:hypothetical protein
VNVSAARPLDINGRYLCARTSCPCYHEQPSLFGAATVATCSLTDLPMAAQICVPVYAAAAELTDLGRRARSS